MLRAMAFIDYQNFDIALKNYFRMLKKEFPRLDYHKMAGNLCDKIPLHAGESAGPRIQLLKTMLFVPEPDEFLLTDNFWKEYDRSLSGLQAKPFLDVIKGRFMSYPVDADVPMDIANRRTFYKVEKGTDINIAANMLTMAFNNSYDIAILVSSDSDYKTVLTTLRTFGKLSFIATVEGQVSKLAEAADSQFTMSEGFFETSLRKRDFAHGKT